MRKYKFFSFILIFSIFSSLLPGSAEAVEKPDIDARAIILMNAETGEVYYEKNADTKRDPASMTKIMTALLALEAIERGEASLDDMVTASNSSHNELTLDGSSQNIVPSETMSLESLLYCLLVSSANEAGNIIGEHIAGGRISDFVAMMNSHAKELGCTNTNFTNAHGLPSDRQYSSARDIAIISAEALKHPFFVELVNTVYKELPATNRSDSRYLMNTNYMINPDRSQYYYSEARGIKTGSSESAGQCLASYVVNDNVATISIVMGCSVVALGEDIYEIQSFTQTKKLMQWFLNNYSLKTVIGTTDLICEVPVELAEGADSVVARPEKDVSMLLPNDIDVGSLEKSYVIFSQRENAEPLTAPVSAGDIVGEISFKYDENTYGPISLVANTSIERSNLEFLKAQIKDFLGKSWVRWLIIGFIIVLIIYLIFIMRYNIRRRKRRRAAHEAAKRGTANSSPFKSPKE